MATLSYYQDAGRPNVTLEDLLRMTALFGYDQQPGLTGESMQHQRQASPYGYGQQTDAGTIAMYDPQGQYLGDDKPNRMSTLEKVIAAIVLAGGGAVVGNALGLLVGAGGGATGASGLTGLDAAALDAGAGAFGGGGGGLSAAGIGSVAPITEASLPAISSAGMAPLSTAGVGSVPSTMAGASALGGGGGAANVLSQLAGGASGLGTLGQLAGGLLGAYDSQNKQESGSQTSARAPWEPAQPLLKGLLGQSQTLLDQYSKQPLSNNQQAAYGNFNGLLNTINSNAGNLMGGFSANASGANNYDRSNPRRQLTGSSFDMSSFLPQLLGRVGG